MNIGGLIRQKKINYREEQIRKKGEKLKALSEEARQAKRYNQLTASEEKLQKEISQARAHQRENSVIGKATKALKKYKKYKDKKGKSGPSGIFVSSGRGPFG